MSISNKRTMGSIGEDIALKYLKENNYIILERNFRVGRLGEIDIIANKDEYICFIEVKTRSNTSFGFPSEAVNRKKQENIRKISQVFLKTKGLFKSFIRFDIVEVFVIRDGETIREREINMIENAF